GRQHPCTGNFQVSSLLFKGQRTRWPYTALKRRAQAEVGFSASLADPVVDAHHAERRGKPATDTKPSLKVRQVDRLIVPGVAQVEKDSSVNRLIDGETVLRLGDKHAIAPHLAVAVSSDGLRTADPKHLLRGKFADTVPSEHSQRHRLVVAPHL